MAYAAIKARRAGNRVILEIDLPSQGEPSFSGRADNLVDPRQWVELSDADGDLVLKMTLCRPYGLARRAGNRGAEGVLGGLRQDGRSKVRW